jgi:hypothetical protein
MLRPVTILATFFFFALHSLNGESSTYYSCREKCQKTERTPKGRDTYLGRSYDAGFAWLRDTSMLLHALCS